MILAVALMIAEMPVSDTPRLLAPPAGAASGEWRVEQKRNTSLWVGGLVLYLVSHASVVIVSAAASNGNGGAVLVSSIPFVGPLIIGCVAAGGGSAIGAVFGFGGLALEVTSAIMFGVGLRKRPVLVWHETEIGLVPGAPGAPVGLSAVGYF